MALDILIVDDEKDIRDLVSGVLEDEGFSTRTAANSQRGAAGARRTAAVARPARRLAAGFEARRAAIARGDQAPRPDAAGADHLRPRQSRHRGRGDPPGRGRLHRKAVRGRASRPSRHPRDRDRAAASARMRALRLQVGNEMELTGVERGDQQCPRDAEARRRHRQPGADLRAGGGRQGGGGAAAAQLEPARARAVRRRHRGADDARAGRGGIVRRGGRGRARPSRPARTGAWRHAVPRRDRRHAAVDPGARSCAC